jgi:hypothetical protein
MSGNKIDTRELSWTKTEPAMTDTGKGETGMADEALNLAKSAVDSASAHVDEVSRHFSDAVEKARQPEKYLELLRKATVAAPIGMLVTAFIAGALFGSRRRRR